MEFLLGFILAISAVLVFRFFIAKDYNETQTWQIRYSQTRIHEIIKNYIPEYQFEVKKLATQSNNHKNSMYTRVVFVENQAYWIKNNTLFVADMEEGMVNEETAREVDTMAMNKVQLDRVINIVEALTEGKQE
jgi:hypothetical protein